MFEDELFLYHHVSLNTQDCLEYFDLCDLEDFITCIEELKCTKYLHKIMKSQ